MVDMEQAWTWEAIAQEQRVYGVACNSLVLYNGEKKVSFATQVGQKQKIFMNLTRNRWKVEPLDLACAIMYICKTTG